MATSELQSVAAAARPADQTSPRLRGLARELNRRIARRANGRPTLALLCECEDRGCTEALEAPADVFRVVVANPRFFLVRPTHGRPLERVVRRERDYAVVDRVA